MISQKLIFSPGKKDKVYKRLLGRDLQLERGGCKDTRGALGFFLVVQGGPCSIRKNAFQRVGGLLGSPVVSEPWSGPNWSTLSVQTAVEGEIQLLGTLGDFQGARTQD